MQLPYSDKLNIAPLNRIFDNKSECYKLFWFQAVMSFVERGVSTVKYGDLINEMIADAWYMVSEYHLNLGPNDTLEKAVNRLHEISDLCPAEKKENILEYLEACRDPEVVQYKKTLTLMVPYRLHSPFISGSSQIYDTPGGLSCLIDRLNGQPDLMYYFSAPKQMETEIYIQEDWAQYLNTNQEIISGWIRFHMVEYLQKRNPAVPGIIDKLNAPATKKLEQISRYWKMLMEIQPIYEIYQGKLLITSDVSIDHFVPWSYVAHDEFWNLHPTTKENNSSKGNRLPNWEEYFIPFAKMEYESYQMVQKYEAVKTAFEKCAREHLNNQDIKAKLYCDHLEFPEFCSRLHEVVKPVYHAAESCGFTVWDRTEKKVS